MNVLHIHFVIEHVTTLILPFARQYVSLMDASVQ